MGEEITELLLTTGWGNNMDIGLALGIVLGVILTLIIVAAIMIWLLENLDFWQ